LLGTEDFGLSRRGRCAPTTADSVELELDDIGVDEEVEDDICFFCFFLVLSCGGELAWRSDVGEDEIEEDDDVVDKEEAEEEDKYLGRTVADDEDDKESESVGSVSTDSLIAVAT